MEYLTVEQALKEIEEARNPSSIKPSRKAIKDQLLNTATQFQMNQGMNTPKVNNG